MTRVLDQTANTRQMKTCLLLCLLVCGGAWSQNVTRDLDRGCIGSTTGDGRPAIGCVRSGCCEYNLQVSSLCEGDNVVCCYTRDLCDGDILCTGSVASDGSPAVGCVDKGCCEYDFHIENPDYCAQAGTVCCYSFNKCGSGSCANVRKVSRSQWGARPPTSVTSMSLPVSYLFLHHTVTPECFTASDCEAEMRKVQNIHMDGNGWSDIGYNWLVGGDGRVYEGRGWNRVGGHTYGYNSVAVAISFLGDFTSKLPNEAALQAAKDLINCAETSDGALTSSYRMFGHRDAGCTACPGNTLYPHIQTWPKYSFDDIPKYC